MATFTVDTLADENDAGATVATPGGTGLSLREAITLANGNVGADTITFAAALAAGGTITLGGTSLNITGETTIDNGTTPDIVIDADGLSSVITATANLTIKGLTITGGATDAGILGTHLTIENSAITGNAAGGIAAGVGSITVSNSTISDNNGAISGGGIALTNGTVTVSNSTISGNSASMVAGGISVTNGTINLDNSTVTGNSASTFVGGVGLTLGTINATNSIILGNSAPSRPEFSITSGSLVNSNSIVSGVVANVFAAVDPVTGGGLLADNGGPVQTVALKADPANPALDKGGAGSIANDARGLATFDFAGVANSNGNARDLGAFEMQLADAEERSLVVTILTDTVDPLDNETSLREAIAFANDPAAGGGTGDADGDTFANDTITFAASLASGGTITLGGTELTITAPTTIDNGTTPDITIDANNASRVFVILSGATTTLRGLVMEHGSSGNGGAIRALSALTIEDSMVRNSQTTGNNGTGGGIAAFDSLTLTNTTVSGNSTSGDDARGGGIFGGTITLTNSTISGNSTTGLASTGGGISSTTGTLSLSNSTVSGNSTTGGGAEGGGIKGATVILTNSTVSGNSTAAAASTGGGIFANTSLTLTNSLVIGNVTKDAGTAGEETGGFAVPSNVNSIVGGGTVTAADVFASTYTIAGTSVLAGTLADNGAPVQTIALKADPANPALDEGDASSTTSDARGEATFDIASVTNSNGNARDLGAFELQYLDAVAQATAEARSLVVTISTDVLDPFDNQTSLREAIAFANDPTAGALADGDADNDGNANDTITFDSALDGDTIMLALGQLEATAPVTIDGDIDNDHFYDISIDANHLSRVLSTTAETTLAGLNIKNGKTTDLFGSGAGISADAALTVVDSVIRDNQTTGNQSLGAGIFAGGTLTMTGSMVIGNGTTGTLSMGGGIFAALDSTLSNSTIANNSTIGSLASGGGIVGVGHLALSNVTVARNTTKDAQADGGGIFANTVTINNSTITGNSTAGSSADGGGIYAITSANASNSLVLGNVTTLGGGDNAGGAPFVQVNGVIGGDAADYFYQTSNVIDANGVDTGVTAGVLGDYGGPVNTVALKPDPANFALDRGTSSSTTGDARGQATFDFASIANTNGNARDLGAFELDYTFASLAPGAETRSLVVTILGDVLDPFDNQTSLREAIAFANDPFAGPGATGDADGLNGAFDTITFAQALSGGTISLTHGQLLATAPVVIDGDIDNDNAPDITIDAHQASRVILLTGAGTLRGLILENGKTTGINESGGAVRGTTLTIEDSIVRNSSTTDDNAHGGGVYSNSSLTLVRSTVTGNSTNGLNATGGGVRGTTVTLTDSTVSGNSTTKSGSEGGGVFASTLNATDSTISGNSTQGQFAQGGGAFGFTVNLTNTTVSGNSTIAFGAHGGGISSQDATLTNTTVTGNSIAGTNPKGGGVYVAGPVKVYDSLIVGNVKSNSGATVDNLVGTTTVTNYRSLISGDATLLFAQTANVIDGNGVDTGIKGGTLADNGGPVQTVALLPVVTNPALDAGDDALDPAADARGQARVNVPGVANNGANISDLGAFEVTNVAPFVANAIPDQSSFEEFPWQFTFAANAFTDPEGVSLTYTAALADDSALPAWLTFNGATRTFSGTPPLDFFGVLDIKVTASDGSLSTSDVFRLTIVDVADNYAPDAVDDTVTGLLNTPTSYPSTQLLANDSDPENNPFRLIAVFNGIGGSVSASDTGVVTFTPVTGFSGQASFRYAIGDSFGGFDTATVTVNIAPPASPPSPPSTPDPHAPVAPSSNAVWTVANFASPTVVIGASDPDGDIVSYAVKPGSGPAKGSVSFAGDSFVYSPLSGAQGADAFTIRISDAGGRSAEQVVNVAIVPVPTPSDWLYLADDGERVTLGGKGQVFATTDHTEITVVPVPGMLSLDGSFNAGGDVVRLSGVAAQWQAALSGSTAILTDGATFVQIPAGPAGLVLVFEDGMRNLRIDTATSTIRIGAQALTETYAPIAAAPQVLSLPTGFDTSAHGALLMNEQGTAIVKGTMQVFGTPADGERIVMLGGTIGFDGSFNGGGDTIVFPGPAASFSAQTQGSAVVVARTGLSAQIPFGLESTTLAFTDAAHPLFFDGLSSIFIGNQIIGTVAAPLTFA